MVADLNYFVTNGFHQGTDFRDLFHLPKNFCADDVKSAYKKLMRLYHPDKHSESQLKKRYQIVTQFINHKKLQALQWLKGKDEPDNPPGEETSFAMIHTAMVAFQPPGYEDEHEHEHKSEESEFEEDSSVDMEDAADTQGVKFHPASVDGGDDEEEEEGHGNGNGSSAGPSSTAAVSNTNHSAAHHTASGGVCVCNNRAPHYHLLFRAPGLSQDQVRCPLCPLTYLRNTVNKSRLAQHMRTIHKVHAYTRDPLKKAPMSVNERVRKHRTKKNIAKHGLYLQG